jgi:hypothetical protein
MKDFLGNYLTSGSYCLYSEDGCMRMGKVVGFLRGGNMVKLWRVDDDSKEEVLKHANHVAQLDLYAVPDAMRG